MAAIERIHPSAVSKGGGAMNRAGLDINHEEILVNIVYLLENKNFDYVRNILTDLHPADIADYVERMDADYR
ncbi:MAG: hypothetical protein KDG51_19380, partial [Calditrichaeota bacterium]|nr:hypothetical protein [Calditrichota bacterium]